MTNNFPKISEYVGLGSAKINRALRESKNIDKVQCDIDLLKIELQQLEPLNNTTVYRNDHIIEWIEYSVFFKHLKGKIIKRPEFLSVFQNKRKENSLFHLIIKTAKKSRCMNIVPVLLKSPYHADKVKAEDEKEGIFLPGTNFKIIDVDDKNQFIFLEETQSDSLFTYNRNVMINHPCLKNIIKERDYPESASEKGLI